MEEPVTVRDLMNRTFAGVTEGDSVQGAASVMHEEGVNSAIVLRGQEPVGMLTATDVIELIATDRNLESTAVGDVMSDPLVTIEADAQFSEAVDVIASKDIRRIVVIDDEEVIGLLTEHDVVAAHTVLPGVTHRNMATEPQAVASVDDPNITPQGVCEVCGSLSGSLTDHNGQLVCEDCLGV